MSYTVLARKYRSRTFDEVVGQEPIATTLANAVRSGRIHHGYLFTGTRGVGKTSMARILAKALNCLEREAPSDKPCLECDACTAIAEGQDVDVVEIDAASNTGVDNIRELRSNAAFRPARCRFKIYIIDEVHMLSTGAFNALLKTLEEPPAHVKFILATTEIQKVPPTIQSRCQRFNFRAIGPQDVAGLLDKLLRLEGFDAEPAAVQRIARLANGSMRDALSMLDQILSVGPVKLTAALLDEVLPPAHDERVFSLLERIADADVAGALRITDETLGGGRGIDVFCADLIETTRALMLLKACGSDSELADVPAAARQAYVALTQRFELSHFIQMIATFEELRRSARFSGAGRALCDAIVVRLANLRNWSGIEQLIRQLPSGGTSSGLEKKKPLISEPDRSADAPAALPASLPEIRSHHAADVTRPVTSSPAAYAPTSRGAPREPARAAVSPGLAANTPVRDPLGAGPEPARDLLSGGPSAGSSSQTLSAPPAAVAPPRRRDADSGAAPAHGRSGPALVSDSGPSVRLQLTGEERARVLADPVIRETLDLFDGLVVSIEGSEAVERRLAGVRPDDSTSIDAAARPDDAEAGDGELSATVEDGDEDE
ncbi:MAG: DNA polymerase III subunit gamma/tau [Phycisphaerales bacterium]|nr:DNA polymerase III subunit gamma/tau [Phycisphaerales bacterium]